jgi:hypothetical protein
MYVQELIKNTGMIYVNTHHTDSKSQMLLTTVSNFTPARRKFLLCISCEQATVHVAVL